MGNIYSIDGYFLSHRGRTFYLQSFLIVSFRSTRHVKQARAEGKESLFWGWMGMAKTAKTGTPFLPRL
jgi:hypothetical protein